MNLLKSAICLVGLTSCSIVVAQAQTVNVLNETFDTYTAGPLLGQGGWAITGTSTTNPITVTNPGNAGFLTLANTGQDAYEPFTTNGTPGGTATTVPHTDGNSLSTTFSLTVASISGTTGDYFAHLSNPAGTTQNFYERIYAKTATGGFTLGLSDIGATPVYGTTVLALNTLITVNVIWNFVPGALNDTFQLNVNGVAYSTFTWASTTAEPTAIAAFNVRQGGGTGAPVVSNLDNVSVDSITAGGSVPEPATYAYVIGAFGVMGLVMRRRRVVA